MALLRVVCQLVIILFSLFFLIQLISDANADADTDADAASKILTILNQYGSKVASQSKLSKTLSLQKA
jgi:hypothetical protein